MRNVLAFVGLALTLIGNLVWGAARLAAQPRPEAEQVQWSVGLGVISSPRPYLGAENSTRAIPVVDLETKRFYFRGIQAGFELVDNRRFSLDLIGRAQFAGFEEQDSEFLAGMEDRRPTIEAGVAAAWKLGSFELGTTLAADALGRSDGVQASLELTWARMFGRGKAGLFPGVGLIWQDSNFVDYYAGVRPEEARPDRPAFQGDSALNLGGGIRGFLQVSDRVRLVTLLRGERLADEYENSPIIESRWGYFGLIAVVYEF